MINKYFQAGNTSGTIGEQRLLESLIIESIQIYGHEVFYIPRTSIKEDTVFGEDVLSQFTGIFPVEMYLNNVEGWGGDGEFMSKFGIQVRNDAVFVVSRRRWEEAVSLQTENVQLPTRPAEGDLIYFPKTQAFFEITYTNHLNPFYQLADFYMYEMQCSMFRYSSESIVTGNAEVDQHALDHSSDLLDYMLLDGSGNPLVDSSGNPIIGSDFDLRTVQPSPNDAEEFDTRADTIVNFDEKNPFNESP